MFREDRTGEATAVKLLMPLPDTDFDTTEVAVPWRLLTDRGHSVVFATQDGDVTPSCDPAPAHRRDLRQARRGRRSRAPATGR